MSVADNYTFSNSLEQDENNFIFDTKQYVYVPDSNNTSYSGGQIRFDATALSNSGKLFDSNQSFITIPLVLQMAVGTGTCADAAENAFCLSLKNGYHQLINSISVELGNNQIVNITNFSNLDINYQLLSSMSGDTLQNFGSSIDFFPDTYTSIRHAPAQSAFGVGECNNVIDETVFNSDSGYGGTRMAVNEGRYHRMLDTSFDSTTANILYKSIDTARLNNVAKNYVVRAADLINYHILATIPLRILHPIFQKLPLMRNSYFRIILNTNCQSSSVVTVATAGGNKQFSTYTSTTQNTTLPFMISPCAGGFVPTTDGTFRLSLGIGKSLDGATSSPFFTQCRLYACLYTFSPMAEQRYFSQSKKKILYNDILSYQILNVQAGANINELITNGISRPRYLLIYPFLSSLANGAQAITSTAAGLGSPMGSPFSSAPATCSPYCFLTNFNVMVSGSNVFQSNINYNFENFLQQWRQGNSLNGGITDNMSSGLIDKNAWSSGYNIVYVDLSKKISQASDDISRAIQITGTNASLVSVDYYVIVSYQRELLLSTSTGNLIFE